MMAIDYTKPIETECGVEARYIGESGNPAWPHLVLVHESFEQSFNDDGEPFNGHPEWKLKQA